MESSARVTWGDDGTMNGDRTVRVDRMTAIDRPRSERPVPVISIASAGVGLGFTADVLLRAPGEPALNLFLLFAGLAASLVLVARTGGPSLSREAAVLLAIGVLSAGGLLWRGSEMLRFLAFVSAATAFALVALHAGRAWVRRSRVSDLVEALAGSAAWGWLGSFSLFRRDGWEAAGFTESNATARRTARVVVVGVLLAALPLFVFGALFISADRVFATMIGDFVRIDLQSFASHVVVGGILSWLACGYLAGFSSGTRLDSVRKIAPARPSLGTAEVALALGMVDLLFLGFVVVQFRYLFGGAGWVEVTPGVTYAAYAREGFFQLVAATALGIPWLLVADGLLSNRESAGRWVFRAFAGVQLVLLLAIVASAVQRMRAYLNAYGLTEDRFVATAVLVWLALLVVWFGATVLRGRRSPFALGALASAYGLVAVLQVANPAAAAASSHLDRAGEVSLEATGSDAVLDVRYLASLGSDAAPILVRRLDELDASGRCQIARRMISRWGPERDWDWRNWNAADWRAKRAVESELSRLRADAGEGDTCSGIEAAPVEASGAQPAT